MAKKAVSKADQLFAGADKPTDPILVPRKRGRTIKPCPSCGALAGIKGGKCANPACGYEYPTTTRVRRKPSAAANETVSVLRFIIACGGAKQAMEKVQEVNIDPVTRFVMACGGVSEALEAIEGELRMAGLD